ncbi:MAG: glycine reductase complex component subunit gamma, partial [Acidimicrobiaceae bacterium]|nr:glycine reductase complex component subunit gamma [Acidimicrobiaceae bacterium]
MLLCNLISIAERVGAPRIVPTRGIPYPTGDPS